MKNILYILLLFSCELFAQMTSYVPYRCGDKWGFLDRSGLRVVEAKYDTVSLFNEGFAVVGLKNRFGLIDTNGVFVLPLKFEEVKGYDDENDFVKARKNDKWNYFNKKGQKIRVRKIQRSVLYDCVSISVSSGMAYLYLHESNGKYGFVKYLCNNVEEDSCRILQKPLYTDYVEVGRDYLALEDNNGWNLYGYEGELIKDLRITNIKKEPLGRRGNKFYLFDIDNKYGLLSTEGEIIVEPKYDSISERKDDFYSQSKEWYWSSEELFLVTIANDYFYIDQNGMEYRCK